MALDFTHDASASSWVASAQQADCDFTIQNLPFGIFDTPTEGRYRGGIAIGDQILDLARLASSGALNGAALVACNVAALSSLNEFMSLGPMSWRTLRHEVFKLLHSDTSESTRSTVKACLVPMSEARVKMPVDLRNYTDFFTSLYHAENCGRLVRPDQPLTPNFKWMPIAYHGRASSVVISGTPFHRPVGQSRSAGSSHPTFGPCKRLDFELELGFFVGPATQLGQNIPPSKAREHIFGMCLMNDWSARDHQFWEMDPLGPFLGKNFCTTISPWIVTMDALEPYRTASPRQASEPQPLAYLYDEGDQSEGSLDIQLEVAIQTLSHVAQKLSGDAVTRTSFRHQYWTIAQMLVHHTIGGCNMDSGDLLGTGTISGPTQQEAGSLVELTTGGTTQLSLPSTGEQRAFLEDGDTVILRGWCQKEGLARIGFGECRGKVLPARH